MAILVLFFSQFVLMNISKGETNSVGENKSIITEKVDEHSENTSDDSFLGISVSKELTPLVVFLVVGTIIVIGISRFHRRRRRPKSKKRKKRRNIPIPIMSPGGDDFDETDLCSTHSTEDDISESSPPPPPSVPLFYNEGRNRPPPPSYEQAMTTHNTAPLYL